MDRTSQIALVLSGGNALGAYHAGAYEQLHQNGIRPDWIVGASIGAVTGAILAGNAPEDRLPKLNQFWAEAMVHTSGSLSVTEKGRQIYSRGCAFSARSGAPRCSARDRPQRHRESLSGHVAQAPPPAPGCAPSGGAWSACR